MFTNPPQTLLDHFFCGHLFHANIITSRICVGMSLDLAKQLPYISRNLTLVITRLLDGVDSVINFDILDNSSATWACSLLFY
jgi:hypothetical protein